MFVAALIFALIALCYWGLQLVVIARVIRSVPMVHELPEGELPHWPRVSAIMTARNEELALEGALRARLAEDYPSLELILVDDRSTDRTGEIADRLAKEDPRLEVVHLREVPPGWLGKLNALQRGLEASSGDWIVFSDADTAIHKGVLRRLIAHCESRKLDHCALLPRLLPVNPVLDCLTSTFLRLIALNLRIWAIEDPNSSTSIGMGAFNLVRKSALARTPGLQWLKMEVADDLTLGQMLKACGARQSVVNGRDLAEIVFHQSLRDSLVSAERATFTAIGNFSLLRLSAMAAATLLLELSPLCALAFAREPLSLAIGAAALALALVTMIVSNRWFDRSCLHLPLFPLAGLITAYSMLRSGILGTIRKGIIWRGTFYSNAELKAGGRFGRSWAMLRNRT